MQLESTAEQARMGELRSVTLTSKVDEDEQAEKRRSECRSMMSSLKDQVSVFLGSSAGMHSAHGPISAIQEAMATRRGTKHTISSTAPKTMKESDLLNVGSRKLRSVSWAWLSRMVSCRPPKFATSRDACLFGGRDLVVEESLEYVDDGLRRSTLQNFSTGQAEANQVVEAPGSREDHIMCQPQSFR